MKNSFIVLASVLVVTLMGFSVTYSQDSEPPSDLPLFDTTATATTQAYATVEALSTATATATVNEISAEDEAETGPEVYILAGLSLIAGFGIYFIKKYFDIKRYSI